MYSKIPRTRSFHVVVLQRTAKKCTKNNNARAKPLFCSLNLLFCGVLIAVMVCLKVPNHHLRLASRKNRPLVEFSRISLHSSTRLRFLSKKKSLFPCGTVFIPTFQSSSRYRQTVILHRQPYWFRISSSS